MLETHRNGMTKAFSLLIGQFEELRLRANGINKLIGNQLALEVLTNMRSTGKLSACALLGCRLMAGQRFLVPYVRVRLLPPQPFSRRKQLCGSVV